MPSKLLILAGAPDPRYLDWSTAALLSEFSDPIARFAGISRFTTSGNHTASREPTPLGTSHSSGPADISNNGGAVWRSIPLERAHLHTGFLQQHIGLEYGSFQHSSARFFTTNGAGSFSSSLEEGDRSEDYGDDDDSDRDLVSQFYEHSLAVHQDGGSQSQLVNASGEPSQHLLEESFISDSTSFFQDETTDPSLAEQQQQQQHSVKAPLGNQAASNHLSDIEDIPAASYLNSIEPQTMSVNLIVGVISIAAPRTVMTRWGSRSTLVEVLVGDETKSGFAITFWVSPVSDGPDAGLLAGLRPQDVLLLQNVGLNVFRKRVYGSSLRRNLTKVHLLHRRKLDARDAGGYYSTADMRSKAGSGQLQLAKTQRVWEWVLNFVGMGAISGEQAGARPAWEKPPPDTQ